MFLFRGTRLRRIYPFSQNITPRSCRYICLSLCLSFSLSVPPEAIAILFPLYWERSLVLGVLSNVWVTQPDATLWHGWTTSSGQPSYRHLMSQSRCAISVHRPYPHSWSVVTTDSKGTWLQLLHPKRARTHTHVERDCRQMSKPDITSHTSYIRRSGLYLVDAVVPVAWEWSRLIVGETCNR